MKKSIALTGASGQMGLETIKQFMESEYISKVRVLLLPKRYEMRLAKRWQKLYGDKLEVLYGNIASEQTLEKFVHQVDYVCNLAAVIPPYSDKAPNDSKECNYFGARKMVEVIERIKENQPKLIHISTVAVYGNRDHSHPWGRVGDPLLPSVYDCYASHKTHGERIVLESNIKTWVVLRQTAMLHNRMLHANLNDGLMFHTCYNTPLEWVTARDSGRLMRKIVEKDAECEVEGFWKKVYNIGGGEHNRATGYDTFNGGFKIIGGSTEAFMKPHWNSIRNFHGMWFYDSDQLEKLFAFREDSIDSYWGEIERKFPYMKIAKFIPPKIISKLVIERLLSDNNSPRRWIQKGEHGKVMAYFGSVESAESLPKDWNSFHVFSKGSLPNCELDYENMLDINKVKNRGLLLSHGYDEEMPDCTLTISDMKKAAEFRGGKCLSEEMVVGDLYTKLEWECCDKHKFFASPYTVIKAGHWCPQCMQLDDWDFDRLARQVPFYAQVWYDTHSKEENCRYYFDSSYNAKYEMYN